ncbi:VanZ family protein [Humidisolicoccus flavus]|uniref:VanZ family protein n=1 Tax=Humidisolicoccus flavus TaxID=3111414 RepID=UPI003250A94D
MISTLLASNPQLAKLLLALALLLCLALGTALVFSKRNHRRSLLALTGLSLLGVLALTLIPSGRITANPKFCSFDVIVPSAIGIEPLANIALFIPLALFGGLAFRRPLLAGIAAILLSVCIEIAQGALPFLGRACDLQDLLTNAVGAIVGTVLALAIVLLHRQMTQRSREPRDSTTR